MPVRSPRRGRLTGLVCALAPLAATASHARADDGAAPSFESDLAFDLALEEQPPPNARPPFASEGSSRWSVIGGYGIDAADSDNTEIMLKLGAEHYIADDLALGLELDLAHFNQEGPHDALGVGASFMFRWHFWSEVNWSLYFEGGIGLMYTTYPVPQDGTRLNFTPEAGFGASFDITPDLRTLVGVRWHHVSNANTSGSNPGRDHIFGYVGLSVPF